MQTTFATEEKLYTVEEYLEMEERSPEKHEYFNGKIVVMAGAHHTYNQIANSIAFEITGALYDEDYIVYSSDMKVFIPQIKSLVYPDVVVVCNQPELYDSRGDTILNPLLIVEVASPATARHDRTKKFWYYQSIPSFKEYVIIEQDFSFVKSFYKTAEHTWVDSIATELEQSIYLQSIHKYIQLKRIYKGVKF